MTPLSISHLPAGTPWWIFAAVIAGLVLHIGGGSLAILSGYAAVWVRKGAPLHRAFGTAFVLSMLTMGAMGASLAVRIHQKENVIGGILAVYLVATAWMTVKRQAGTVGRFEIGALVAALCVAGSMLIWGFEAVTSPTGTLDGASPALFFIFGSFAAFAGALDLKVIRQGGISGTPRIARHLWRMCFALFFAAASFFLGQQKVMPAFMHGSPLLFIPALAPLALMIYWLFRVRSKRPLRREALALRSVEA